MRRALPAALLLPVLLALGGCTPVPGAAESPKAVVSAPAAGSSAESAAGSAAEHRAGDGGADSLGPLAVVALLAVAGASAAAFAAGRSRRA